MKQYLDADIIIMCAAVSDYTPKKQENVKIKSKTISLNKKFNI